jgi:hypothetical protein
MMPARVMVMVLTLMLPGLAAANPASASQGSGGCRPSGNLMALAELSEASGLVASRTTAGRLWLHNDSGAPVLFAVDQHGKSAGRLTVTGARVEDWEALATGPCGSGSCLYIGDIGDNGARRKQITIYRVPEPAQAGGSAKAEVFSATYPDGAQDAEALMVAPDGAVIIVTKGEAGPIAAYRFPKSLQPNTIMRLEKIGVLANKAGNDKITDGAFSSDGQWVALRTKTALTFYRGADFLKGDFGNGRRVDLSGLREPQGEAIAFGAGDHVYVAGEGGGKKQPGTLGQLSCKP